MYVWIFLLNYSDVEFSILIGQKVDLFSGMPAAMTVVSGVTVT